MTWALSSVSARGSLRPSVAIVTQLVTRPGGFERGLYFHRFQALMLVNIAVKTREYPIQKWMSSRPVTSIIMHAAAARTASRALATTATNRQLGRLSSHRFNRPTTVPLTHLYLFAQVIIHGSGLLPSRSGSVNGGRRRWTNRPLTRSCQRQEQLLRCRLALDRLSSRCRSMAPVSRPVGHGTSTALVRELIVVGTALLASLPPHPSQDTDEERSWDHSRGYTLYPVHWPPADSVEHQKNEDCKAHPDERELDPREPMPLRRTLVPRTGLIAHNFH